MLYAYNLALTWCYISFFACILSYLFIFLLFFCCSSCSQCEGFLETAKGDVCCNSMKRMQQILISPTNSSVGLFSACMHACMHALLCMHAFVCFCGSCVDAASLLILFMMFVCCLSTPGAACVLRVLAECFCVFFLLLSQYLLVHSFACIHAYAYVIYIIYIHIYIYIYISKLCTCMFCICTSPLYT